MALTRCPECQHEVSTRATSCPHCGYPIHPQPQPRSWHDDPDLARLVERERREREQGPVSTAIGVMVALVIVSIIAIVNNAPALFIIIAAIAFIFLCIFVGLATSAF